MHLTPSCGRSIFVFGIAALALFSARDASAAVILSQNFDNSGLNSPFSLDTTIGTGANPEILTGGPTGSFARVTHASGSINRSIAFDLVALPAGTTQMTLRVDFRLSDDATNASTGGCCGEAADGIGIGFYPTALYGSTGPSNPATVAGNFEWEQGGHNGAVKFGLDIFDGGATNPNGNRLLVHNGNVLNGGFVAENKTPGFTLNNNLFNRLQVTITDTGADSIADVFIIEDVNGTAVNRQILDDVVLTGFDLNNFNHRLIIGGRTGGAWHNGDVDNVQVETVPEPSVAAMLGGLGLIGLLRRRRNR